MENDAGIQKVLEEIRDTLREQVAEYKRVENESLEIQKRAAARQESVGALYKQYVFIVGAVAIAILVLIFYLYMR
jgi:type VI protein secretion system component VasF